MILRLAFLSILISGICNEIMAQSSVLFNSIDQTNGLSNGSVTKIIQDAKGFIWIGTKNGIDRYDGLKFRIYDTYNSGLGANDISNIFIDDKQRMWVSTIGGGLSIYDQAKDEFYTFQFDQGNPKSISSSDVQVIEQDREGNVWIGTEHGLNKFMEADSSFEKFKYSERNSLFSNRVMAIFEDESENLWVGTFGGGLSLLNKHSGKLEIKHPIGNRSLEVKFIHQINSLEPGKLLIATSGTGLIEYDIEKNFISSFLPAPFNRIPIVRSVFHGSGNTLWVATDGEGLLKVTFQDGKKVIKQFINKTGNPNTLNSNALYTVFEDNSRNIWIGTAWNGLNVLGNESENLNFYWSDFKGESQKGILSIYADDWKLYFGTDGSGLSTYDLISKGNAINGNFDHYYIQFIEKDKDGSLWIGTFKNGLIHLNNGEVEQFKHDAENKSSISHNDVRDILQLSNNKYLVATWGGGLDLFNPQEKTFTSNKNSQSEPGSIGSDNVISLLAADDGKVWVATFGGGLNLFDPVTETFEKIRIHIKDEAQLNGNNMLTLLKDSNNDLWLGAWGDGLIKWNQNSKDFTRFTTKEGIADNTITALLEDQNGRVWMSTKNGISSLNINGNEINSYPSLKGEYHINSSFADKNGQLFFGNTKGAISFNPDRLAAGNQNPEIVFTELRIFDKQIQATEGVIESQILFQDRIVLSHNQNAITFEFAALNYPFSNQFEYSYFLEGITSDWVNLGNQRSITLTNLMPGNYTLMVGGANMPKSYQNFASIDIEILNPWWKEWWAIATYFILFLILLYGFRHYAVKWEKMKHSLKLEKISREKEAELHDIKMRFFTNISHEIRTPITLMLGAINRMEEKGVLENLQKKALVSLRRNGNRLSQLLTELLDFRKLETAGFHLKISQGNLVKFAREVSLSFNDIALQKKIDFQFQADAERIEAWYDKDQMEKVLFNLLHNAFKYANKNGEIRLKVERDDENIFIRILNTGFPIPSEELRDVFKRFYQSDNTLSSKKTGTGLGLAIAKEIVHLHSGELLVESGKRVTTFTVKLMFGNDHFSPAELIEKSNSEDISNFYLEESEIQPADIRIKDEELFAGKRVLVVEDNHEVRKYIVEILQTDFTVMEAANGIEALDALHSEMPDLIICDVVMPEMDGITFTSKIKSNRKTSHIPVIILTARTSLIYKKEGYETGADEYITKPFSESLLRTRIRSIIRNRELIKMKLQNEFITEPKELAISTPDQQFLEDMMKIIEENIDSQELKAEFICRELAMSHSVVYKKVKALTGLSLIEFIRDFKLKRAAQLMAKYQFSIVDACHKVGFSDRKYFTQIFKSKFGMTPSEYIKVNLN